MSPQKDFVGYEYQEITAPAGQVSFYLDCYENFGWQMDGNVPVFSGKRHATLRMKRDRKLIHKMELTKLFVKLLSSHFHLENNQPALHLHDFQP